MPIRTRHFVTEAALALIHGIRELPQARPKGGMTDRRNVAFWHIAAIASTQPWMGGETVCAR
jgi:hypothetical protein